MNRYEREYDLLPEEQGERKRRRSPATGMRWREIKAAYEYRVGTTASALHDLVRSTTDDVRAELQEPVRFP